jgi:hypothetical protein
MKKMRAIVLMAVIALGFAGAVKAAMRHAAIQPTAAPAATGASNKAG